VENLGLELWKACAGPFFQKPPRGRSVPSATHCRRPQQPNQEKLLSANHIFLDKQHPALWRALNGLGLKVREAAVASGLDDQTVELLNVRISQLNGCAYCLDLHVKKAVQAGETSQRLSVLPAWRETALFTDKERAALALAESITALPGHAAQAHEEAYARDHLTEEEFSTVSWLAITMNAFNRVSITSHHPVRHDRERQ
jgi:AhpD family alkylhydroperoxidase